MTTPPLPETTGLDYQQPSQTLTPSLIRTFVPLVAGLLGTWLASALGANIDTATVGAVVTTVISGAYYAVVRFLEVYASPRWGYILGVNKLPVYASLPLPEVVVAAPQHRSTDEQGAVAVGSLGWLCVLLGLVLLVLAFLTTIPLWVGIVVLVVGAGLLAFGSGRL